MSTRRLRPAALAVVLAAAAVLAAGAEGAASPVLKAHGNADGSVSASWSSPGDLGLFRTIQFMIDSTNAPCVQIYPEQPCTIGATNGTELLPVSTSSFDDRHTYSAGQVVEVQVCYYYAAGNQYPVCSNIAKVTIPAKSGGGSSGGGGTKGGGGTSGTVTFSQTVTIRHADGRTERKTSTILVDGDVVRAYGSPLKITLSGGKVAIDRGTKLQYKPAKGVDWQVSSGTGYFETATPTKVWAGMIVAAQGAGPFTVFSSPGLFVVRSYGATVAVNKTIDATQRVSLRPGQEVRITRTGMNSRIGTPRRFEPAVSQKFWTR